MFLYIDATFKLREPAKSKHNYIGVITADTPGIRDIPPYMLIPKTVIVATSMGDVKLFDNESPAVLLTELGNYMEERPLSGNESCVGWYLDQVIIPVICVNSMMYGVKSVTRWMRKLDEKWAKTFGWSIERAFIQGWYTYDKEALSEPLTLDSAVKICGLPSPADMLDPQDIIDTTEEQRVLMSRIMCMNRLYDRYHNVSFRR